MPGGIRTPIVQFWRLLFYLLNYGQWQRRESNALFPGYEPGVVCPEGLPFHSPACFYGHTAAR